MKITADRYPALGLIARREDTLPKVLPFTCENEKNRDPLLSSPALYDLFYCFATRNTEGKPKEKTRLFHYVISELLLYKLKSKRRLSQLNFHPYLNKSCNWYGGIVIADPVEELHYVYRVRNLDETMRQQYRQGVYYSIGYFKGGNVLGFEDGFLEKDGKVSRITGIYDGNTPVGGYLYFIGALMRHIERYNLLSALPHGVPDHAVKFNLVSYDEDDK
jgi:hypothetical protein